MKRNSRLTLASAAAATLGLGLALFGGTTAATAASYGDCSTSQVCVYTGKYYGGDVQRPSGFAAYTDLNSTLQDNAESWINANNYQVMKLGEWRNGGKVQLDWLNPTSGSSTLGTAANRADYVEHY